MAKLLIKPNFNRIGQQVSLPAKKLNLFLRTEMLDSFGFYQRAFGLYSYMKLTSKLKYVIHTLTGQPLMWQSNRSCSWNPTGSLRVGKSEFEPCEAKINEEFCDDELMKSCFEHLNAFSNGRKTPTPEQIQMINELIRVLTRNSMLGARLLLTAGQMYNFNAEDNKIEFNDKTTKEQRDLVKRTIGTCRGWVELARQMALNPKYGHMNCQDIFSESDFSGKKYQGDVVEDIYEKLLDKAPASLCSLIDEGGIINAQGDNQTPLFVVSTHLYKCIAETYRKECRQFCRDPRITQRDVTVAGFGTKKVYYIDDTPVIPLSDLNCYDVYLKGCTHFAAIVSSGVIGLGSSYDSLPDIDTTGQGLILERGTQLKDSGKYFFGAQSLFSAAIADSDYFVGTQIHAVPA